MNCDEIQGLLHDYLTDMLDDSVHRKVKEHLESCILCADALENIKTASFLLDQWKIPEVAPDLEHRVLRRIEERETEKKGSRLAALLKKIFKPYPIKLPLTGLAAVAIVFFAMNIYRIYISKSDYNIKNLPKEIQIKLNEAKRPIIIESKDIEKTYDDLKNILHKHNGSISNVQFIKDGMMVIISIGENEESPFFNDLKQLGGLCMEKDGYKDKHGMVVVVVIKSLSP